MVLGHQEAVRAIGALGGAGASRGEGDEGRRLGGDFLRGDGRVFFVEEALQLDLAEHGPSSRCQAQGNRGEHAAQAPEELDHGDSGKGLWLGEGDATLDLRQTDPGVDEDDDDGHLEECQEQGVELEAHRDHDDDAIARL
ncbi:hypothetical protein D3C87_1789140 [compost metagenome]